MVHRRGAARQEVVAGLDVDKAVAIAGGPEMFCAMNTFIAPAYRLYCKGVRSTETFSDVRHEAKVLSCGHGAARTQSVQTTNAHAHARLMRMLRRRMAAESFSSVMSTITT